MSDEGFRRKAFPGRTPLTRILRGATLAMALLGLSTSTAVANDFMEDREEAWRLCAENTLDIEKARALPPFLLTAMSKVESGRWHDVSGEIMAWPWTVTSEEGGKYLPSKKAAIREVRRLQARGIVSIDVGCMQINLLYHPDAFEDLEAALDPARNIAYAASFLTSLHRKQRSWTGAISRYHSATPKFSGSYRLKVLRAWREERQRVWTDRRRQITG